jgi:hypothetical protein
MGHRIGAHHHRDNCLLGAQSMNTEAAFAVIVAVLVLYLLISGKYKAVAGVLGITSSTAATKSQSTSTVQGKPGQAS